MTRLAFCFGAYTSPKPYSAFPTHARSSASVRAHGRALGGVPQRSARKPIAQAALHKRMRPRSSLVPVRA